MKLGIFWFPTAAGPEPGPFGALVEELGFESLWVAEHTHIPVERTSPWPGGAELPREYLETFDPLLTLTAVAAATTELRLGTGVTVIVERDPITLAKELATLDVLSGGRLEVGVGAGWNLEEMENHGTDPNTRFRLMRERVEAMRAIWTEEEASYHGRLVDFDPLWSWPKPVQKPGPRIHIAGAAPGALRRVIAYGDGWIPLPGRGASDFGALATELRQAATEAGRDGDALQVSVAKAPADAETLRRYAAGGVDRALLWVPAGPAEETLAALHAHAELARSL